MNKLALILLVTMFLSASVGADTPKLWDKTIWGSSGETGYGVDVDSNNNIIVVGGTSSFGAGGTDVWTIKYDSNGNPLWNRTLGGSGDDAGYGVTVDSNNNIIVTGKTESFGAGNSDVWTIKYDSNGNPLWNRTIGVE